MAILGQCLSRPVVVRWNSLFSSLQQIYDLREIIPEANLALGIVTSLRDSDFKYYGRDMENLNIIYNT